MLELLTECWQNDIVTVIAAGNDGEDPRFSLAEAIPGCLGTPTNPLITVGAANLDGTRWEGTTQETGGSITTWAPGHDIKCPANEDSGFQVRHGTSLAAPQIAGLAAYFMSLGQDELPREPLTSDEFARMPFQGPNLHIKGKVSQSVKDYIHTMGYRRSPDNDKSVPLAYNGAQDGLCLVKPNTDIRKREKRQASRQADKYGLVPVVTAGILVSGASLDLVGALILRDFQS